jgi:hypothetical protein
MWQTIGQGVSGDFAVVNPRQAPLVIPNPDVPIGHQLQGGNVASRQGHAFPVHKAFKSHAIKTVEAFAVPSHG